MTDWWWSNRWLTEWSQLKVSMFPQSSETWDFSTNMADHLGITLYKHETCFCLRKGQSHSLQDLRRWKCLFWNWSLVQFKQIEIVYVDDKDWLVRTELKTQLIWVSSSPAAAAVSAAASEHCSQSVTAAVSFTDLALQLQLVVLLLVNITCY